MSISDEAVKLVRCPACAATSVYVSSNPFRPFCGERCKQQDLGNWASEAFRLPAAISADEIADIKGPLQ